MTVKDDNPAGKLYHILQKFDSFRYGAIPDTPTIKSRLAHALGIKGEDSASLMYGLLQIHKLIDNIEQQLSAIEWLNNALYIEPLKRIRRAYSIVDMSVVWNRSVAHSTLDTDLTALAFVSEILTHHQPEKEIPAEELQQLHKDIEELHQTVLTSSLPLEAKTLILGHLEIIRKAIVDYRLRGVPALQEALERVAGGYFVNESLINKEAEKDEVKSYKTFLSRFVATVSFASNATKLIEAAAKWLPLLTSGEPPDIPPPPMQ